MPDLSTRTARRRLPQDGRKRWSRLARGHALGYRRLHCAEAGTWYVRIYVGDGSYRMAALATADDVAEPDGVDVLSFGEAAERALAWLPDEDERDAAPRRPVRVRDVVDRYLEWFVAHRKSYDQVVNVFKANILPKLGEMRVDDLTPMQLRRWHQDLAAKPARLRGGQDRKAVTDDQKRARKVSANRALVSLKAALNRAVDDGLVDGPGAWSKVKVFRGVDAARARYLESEELDRLVNVCVPDFRDLVLAAIHTGARYGELAALVVGDYRLEARAIYFARTKNGTPRYVFLSDQGETFFNRLTAGRKAGEVLLLKANGSPWGCNHHSRSMREACAAGGIDPPVVFHQLRHSYASLYLMSGGSLVALAKQLGHTTTRMVEKHHGHLR